MMACLDARGDFVLVCAAQGSQSLVMIVIRKLDARRTIFYLIAGLSLSCAGRLGAAEEDAKDSAAGLPPAYAKNYLVARSTMSADRRFAVIYPTLDFSESKEAKDLLVALKPFRVLAPLPTQFPYFQHESNGGISTEWSKNNSVALITLESKWGPGDVFAVELAGGEAKRTTNVLDKLTALLLPKFRAAKPKREAFNDNYAFIFEQDEGKACILDGSRVTVDTIATNDPKGLSTKPWSVHVTAEWDIAQAKFTSEKITNEKR